MAVTAPSLLLSLPPLPSDGYEEILLEGLRKAWHQKERRQNRQQLRKKGN